MGTDTRCFTEFNEPCVARVLIGILERERQNHRRRTHVRDSLFVEGGRCHFATHFDANGHNKVRHFAFIRCKVG